MSADDKLRERIHDLLSKQGPMRPKEIAAVLKIDHSRIASVTHHEWFRRDRSHDKSGTLYIANA
jgi:hypothetical protein